MNRFLTNQIKVLIRNLCLRSIVLIKTFLILTIVDIGGLIAKVTASTFIWFMGLSSSNLYRCKVQKLNCHLGFQIDCFLFLIQLTFLMCLNCLIFILLEWKTNLEFLTHYFLFMKNSVWTLLPAFPLHSVKPSDRWCPGALSASFHLYAQSKVCSFDLYRVSQSGQYWT